VKFDISIIFVNLLKNSGFVKFSNADRYTVLSYLAHFSLEGEMFQTKVVEKIKTNNLCSVTFSPKS
jgi:hypothetical protein